MLFVTQTRGQLFALPVKLRRGIHCRPRVWMMLGESIWASSSSSGFPKCQANGCVVSQ